MLRFFKISVSDLYRICFNLFETDRGRAAKKTPFAVGESAAPLVAIVVILVPPREREGKTTDRRLQRQTWT